jgi:hypothetical protein
VGIVEVPLVVIVENFVGLLRGLEPDFCFFALSFGDLVWVVCECGLLLVRCEVVEEEVGRKPCGRPS